MRGRRIYIFSVAVFLAAVLSGCAVSSEIAAKSPQQLFRKAQRAMDEHRFNEAHYYFEQIVKNHPDFPYADEALYKKGYLEVVLGKYADAQKSFEELIKKYPQSEWSFDASLWAGVLGELTACQKTRTSTKVSRSKKSSAAQSDCENQLKKLKSENEELRRQVQMLRKLFEK